METQRLTVAHLHGAWERRREEARSERHKTREKTHGRFRPRSRRSNDPWRRPRTLVGWLHHRQWWHDCRSARVDFPNQQRGRSCAQTHEELVVHPLEPLNALVKDFLSRGGRPWACTSCVKARGYEQSDLIEGVKHRDGRRVLQQCCQARWCATGPRRRAGLAARPSCRLHRLSILRVLDFCPFASLHAARHWEICSP